MELKPYKTLGKKGESLYEDRRSEFLGCAVPVSSEEEAAEFVRSVKKQHPAARHNVWAYVLRDGAERYSDDGEPQGSAGMPVLEVMRKSGICDAAVVVTRYFGGILLGIIEIFAKAYISTQLSDAIVFAVLIVVLLVKPDGLLGKHVSEKV